MAKSNDDGRVGYEFEAELKRVFEKIKKRHKFDYHRYLDSKAAGRLVSPQPGDFQICYLDTDSVNHVIIVEAKGSEEKESLRECASSHIRPQQIGKHKSWMRAGGQAMFWFYCESDGIVEFWNSQYVCQQRSAGEPLELRERIKVIDYLDLENEILKIFNIK